MVDLRIELRRIVGRNLNDQPGSGIGICDHRHSVVQNAAIS